MRNAWKNSGFFWFCSVLLRNQFASLCRTGSTASRHRCHDWAESDRNINKVLKRFFTKFPRMHCSQKTCDCCLRERYFFLEICDFTISETIPGVSCKFMTLISDILFFSSVYHPSPQLFVLPTAARTHRRNVKFTLPRWRLLLHVILSIIYTTGITKTFRLQSDWALRIVIRRAVQQELVAVVMSKSFTCNSNDTQQFWTTIWLIENREKGKKNQYYTWGVNLTQGNINRCRPRPHHHAELAVYLLFIHITLLYKRS